MNLSSILLVVPPEHLEAMIPELNAREGLEVHHSDPKTGRLILTQEAESIGDEVNGLRILKQLPNVVLAEMLEHHFEDDQEIIDGIPPELEDEALPPVPSFLR